MGVVENLQLEKFGVPPGSRSSPVSVPVSGRSPRHQTRLALNVTTSWFFPLSFIARTPCFHRLAVTITGPEPDSDPRRKTSRHFGSRAHGAPLR
jgi:hypothetical protein